MSTEAKLREKICTCGASLFRRGFTFGSTGNISAALPDGGWLMTPTNVSMGDLDPASLSKLDADGRHVGGDKPTKEAFLHQVMYRQRPTCQAVVHLHSTHSVAVSCMHGVNEHDCLPPLTAYYAMRVGTLPLIPYYPPGDEKLAEAVGEKAAAHRAVLLANHGPVVSGKSLDAAMHSAEELEETAKLFLLLRGTQTRPLTAEQADEIRARYPD